MKGFTDLRQTICRTALLAAVFNPLSAWADGTETLGPPSIPIQSGTGIVAAGTGLISQPGTIGISVPGTVKQVLLYWEGQSISPNPGDSTIVVNGNTVTGTLIGGPTLFFSDKQSSTFRADITSLNLVASGPNTLNVQGLNFGFADNGAGVMVVYDDGSPASIQLRDGNDLAFINFAPPLNTTNAQTFTFAPETSDRNATLSMFFSSVQGSVSGGAFRPNAIEITVGGSTTVLNNQLNSNDGDEWDTLTVPVLVPAGATMLTVQALSKDNLNSGNLPASFAWSAAGLSIVEIPTPGQGQGCTPGYWKQSQHFDSWTSPYTPSSLFSAVFENAFPGMTLLQVLEQGGGGLTALGRHTVAALLNAASPDVSYDLTVSEVIAQFNQTFPGTNTAYEDLKNTFEGFNEQGCPLD
ncbi:MAG: hypothetical protein ACREVY_12490 [Gammaproteobacteria bacterium]